MMEESLSCTIKADIQEIPKVSLALDQAMGAHGFSDEEILDTQLAVEEAITNVIVHGYEGTTGKILIICSTTGGLAEIQIEDTAPPFNPLSIPEPDITEDIEDRKIGGLGVFLIRQVMDDIIYRYEDGKNILVLRKKKMG
ncbi:MAG: ATP-binding protein [Methanoregula sp.]